MPSSLRSSTDGSTQKARRRRSRRATQSAPIRCGAARRRGERAARQPVRIVELARRQGVALDALFAAAGVGTTLPRDAIVTADLEIKYAGYFERERIQADG